MFQFIHTLIDDPARMSNAPENLATDISNVALLLPMMQLLSSVWHTIDQLTSPETDSIMQLIERTDMRDFTTLVPVYNANRACAVCAIPMFRKPITSDMIHGKCATLWNILMPLDVLLYKRNANVACCRGQLRGRKPPDITTSNEHCSVESDELCAICFDSLTSEKINTAMRTFALQLRCGHSFHARCVWSIQQPVCCPMCRERFDVYDIHHMQANYSSQIQLNAGVRSNCKRKYNGIGNNADILSFRVPMLLNALFVCEHRLWTRYCQSAMLLNKRCVSHFPTGFQAFIYNVCFRSVINVLVDKSLLAYTMLVDITTMNNPSSKRMYNKINKMIESHQMFLLGTRGHRA